MVCRNKVAQGNGLDPRSAPGIGIWWGRGVQRGLQSCSRQINGLQELRLISLKTTRVGGLEGEWKGLNNVPFRPHRGPPSVCSLPCHAQRFCPGEACL